MQWHDSSLRPSDFAPLTILTALHTIALCFDHCMGDELLPLLQLPCLQGLVCMQRPPFEPDAEELQAHRRVQQEFETQGVLVSFIHKVVPFEPPIYLR